MDGCLMQAKSSRIWSPDLYGMDPFILLQVLSKAGSYLKVLPLGGALVAAFWSGDWQI